MMKMTEIWFKIYGNSKQLKEEQQLIYQAFHNIDLVSSSTVFELDLKSIGNFSTCVNSTLVISVDMCVVAQL